MLALGATFNRRIVGEIGISQHVKTLHFVAFLPVEMGRKLLQLFKRAGFWPRADSFAANGGPLRFRILHKVFRIRLAARSI